MSVVPPIAAADTGITGRLAWAQPGEYDAIDDRAVIAALAGRAARLVQAPTLSAAGGLNVQVGQWLAVIDCGDGTDAAAARTDVIFAEIDLVAATWELKLYSEAETAGKLGVRLGTIGVPAGATQASAMTFTPAVAASAWATPQYGRGLVRWASQSGGNAQHAVNSFGTAWSFANTTPWTLVAGRRYRVTATNHIVVANYTSGNGVINVALARGPSGATNNQLGPNFNFPTKASGVGHAVFADWVGDCPDDIPDGSTGFAVRFWGGGNVTTVQSNGTFVVTLEDMGAF